MLTFGDVKASSIVNIAGKCADSPEFAQLINDAVRRLLRRGDSVGTVTPIHLCVKRGCLVMPRYVGSIRKINICNQPLPMGNLWYNFIQPRDWLMSPFGVGWNFAQAPQNVLTAQGFTSCYADIPGDGWLVRGYPTTPADIGRTVQLFGVDNNNQVLRTDNGDGTWSEGWTLSLDYPFGSPNANNTPDAYVRRIDRTVKQVTQGQVRLYAYQPSTGAMIDLAVYDPGEVTPTYARYNLNLAHWSPCSPTAGCSARVGSVVMLVKLRFIPVKFDSDLVLIDNEDAIKEMVQSIKLSEAGDKKSAIDYETAAIRELNRDLEDTFPDDQFSAMNNVLGGPTWSNQAF